MELTAEFIRGLVVGEGTFSFSVKPTPGGGKRGRPEFTLKMHVRDKTLLESIRNYWHLDERVYEYTHGGRHYAMLVVRDFPDLKDKIIPFFYKKLRGYKAKQFAEWLERFGEPGMSRDANLIYRLYKSGYYDNPKNLIYKWE